MTQISPDETVIAQWGFVKINLTILGTWGVMVLLLIAAWLGTRGLRVGAGISRRQAALEAAVEFVNDQIEDTVHASSPHLLAFVGTLFLFVAAANLLTLVPGYVPPTASLSTTTALALVVFVAVPVFGVMRSGIRSYLRHYLRPTPLMLPFHLIGELSRTLAMAVRLFGNVMSGTKIVAVLVAISPLIFPAVMRVLGLVTGLIQAYIIAVLALVYIASGMQLDEDEGEADREDQAVREDAGPTHISSKENGDE